MHLAQSGVEESFRLDFKQQWEPEKLCPSVGAMANSYGGLLVLGVSDDRRKFLGVIPPKNSDLKTQISSVIAARFAPVPLFEVHTCPAPRDPAAPNDPATLLVVIRVMPQPRLHLYLKGNQPVYVRNEDQTVPANAAQLQALLERVRNAERMAPQAINPLEPIAVDFYVSKALDPTARTQTGTCFKIGLAPESPSKLTVDIGMERMFERLIRENYPSIGQRLSDGLGSTVAESRDRRDSWYRYKYHEFEGDHEAAWALNNRGRVQYICQVEGNGRFSRLWSIADLFVNIESTLQLADAFWKAIGYFGAGQLAATIAVTNLVPHCDDQNYLPLFFDAKYALPRTAFDQLAGSYPVSESSASLLLTYDGRTSNRRKTLMEIGNQLLRNLRFSVDSSQLLEHLEKSLSHSGTERV